MPFYVIDSSNSIHNTDNTTLGGDGLELGAGDSAIIQSDGTVLATGTYGTGIYVNAYADNSTLVVNGFVYGTSQGIYSLAGGVDMTINGRVMGGSTGVGIYGGTLYVSPSAVVSGGNALFVGGASVINDGTLSGTGNEAVQFSSGWLYNNGLITSRGWGIFYSADGNGTIVNTGTIQGDLLTYYAATNTYRLYIENSGEWIGQLGLSPGDDTLINTGTITEGVSLGDGNNSLDSRYGFIGGTVTAGDGIDTILLGAGDNSIFGGGGGDTIDGGAGFDIVWYNDSPSGVSVDLINGTASRGDAQGDRLSNIEGVYGSLYRDVLIGDNRANTINGLLGADTLTGNGGNDTLIMLGGRADVVISGGSGNDTIQLITANAATYGQAFNTRVAVNGGTGYDTLEVTNAPVMTFNNQSVRYIERLLVNDGFSYSFTSVNATVAAGARMWVDGGSLTGSNYIRFFGSAETDGAFDFTGGAFRDRFVGGAGNDTVAGGLEIDVLTGGAGSDTFIYDSALESRFASRDQVTDFNTAADSFQFDVDVTGLDATVSGSVSTAADLAALVSGTFGASHALMVNVTGGSLAGRKLLLVDANGVAGFQSAVDYVIDVTGIVGTLTLADFVSTGGAAQAPLSAAKANQMPADLFRFDGYQSAALYAAHDAWAVSTELYF